jgi:hypothetical protein
MWDILGLTAVVILLVVSVLVALDIEPKDPKWRRRWAWFAGSVLGLFVIWMIILFGFLK